MEFSKKPARVCQHWTASKGSTCPFGSNCRFEHPRLSPSSNHFPASPLGNHPNSIFPSSNHFPTSLLPNHPSSSSFRSPVSEPEPQPYRDHQDAERGMPQAKARRFVPNEPLKRNRPPRNPDEASMAGAFGPPEMEDSKDMALNKHNKRRRPEDMGAPTALRDSRPLTMDVHYFDRVHHEAKNLLQEVKQTAGEGYARCTKLWQELENTMKKREKAVAAKEEKIIGKANWLIAETKKAVDMLASTSRPEESDRPRDPMFDRKAIEAEQNAEKARKHAEEARTYAEEAERSNAERAFQIAELRQRQDTLAMQEVKLDEKQKRIDEAAKKLVEREKQVAAMEAKFRARQASLKQQQLERQQKLLQAQDSPPQQHQHPPNQPLNPPQVPTNTKHRPPDAPGPSTQSLELVREAAGDCKREDGINVEGASGGAERERRAEPHEAGEGSGMQVALIKPKPEPVEFEDELIVDLSDSQDNEKKAEEGSGDEEGGEAEVGKAGEGLAIVAVEGGTGGEQGEAVGRGERVARTGRSGADKCRSVQPKMTVAEALLKDAPELFQTLQEKGLLEGMELYPEPEEEDLEEGENEGADGGEAQFSDLRHLLKKIWESSNLINVGAKIHHSNDNKQIYEVDVLVALLEQARHMDRKGAGPVTRYWCRQLQCFLFIFAWHNRVVLERPEYGYATYVFEVEEGERVDWQIQRLVSVMSVPGVGRLDIWTNKPLQDMKAISEVDVRLLERYGWQRGTGIGTFLNYSDRIVHERGNDEDSHGWFKKVGRMLVDGRNQGRRTKRLFELPGALLTELPSSVQDCNALVEVKVESGLGNEACL